MQVKEGQGVEESWRSEGSRTKHSYNPCCSRSVL